MEAALLTLINVEMLKLVVQLNTHVLMELVLTPGLNVRDTMDVEYKPHINVETENVLHHLSLDMEKQDVI